MEEARSYIERYYCHQTVDLGKPGRFVRVKDDGIYTFMYEIQDNIQRVEDVKGKEYLEFTLAK